MTTTPTGYTDDKLKELRLKYLGDCKPSALKKLKKSGELDSHLQRRADMARRRCANLMATGVFEGQAWQWAIREVLLETERD